MRTQPTFTVYSGGKPARFDRPETETGAETERFSLPPDVRKELEKRYGKPKPAGSAGFKNRISVFLNQCWRNVG